MTADSSNSPPIGAALPGWTPPEFPDRRTLQGQYVSVVPVDADAHAADLFAANCEDRERRNWTYLPYDPIEDSEEYRTWIETYCGGDDPMFFAVIPKYTGKAAGIASYLRIKPDNASIEVGHIHFSPSLQRTAAATEAMFLMMEYAFDLGYRRYEWKCDALNGLSCAAAERLGLSFEGIFRQAMIYKQRNRDTAWFAAIDSEWPQLKDAFQTWLRPENFDSEGRQLQSLSALTGPILHRRRSQENSSPTVPS